MLSDLDDDLDDDWRVIDLETLEVKEEYTAMVCFSCDSFVEVGETSCTGCGTEFDDSFWSAWRHEYSNDALTVLLPADFLYTADQAYDIGTDEYGRQCVECQLYGTTGCALFLSWILDIQEEGVDSSSRPYSLRPCEDHTN